MTINQQFCKNPNPRLAITPSASVILPLKTPYLELDLDFELDSWFLEIPSSVESETETPSSAELLPETLSLVELETAKPSSMMSRIRTYRSLRAIGVRYCESDYMTERCLYNALTWICAGYDGGAAEITASGHRIPLVVAVEGVGSMILERVRVVAACTLLNRRTIRSADPAGII